MVTFMAVHDHAQMYTANVHQPARLLHEYFAKTILGTLSGVPTY